MGNNDAGCYFPACLWIFIFGILLNNLEGQWRFLAVLPLILIAADLTEGIFQIQLLKAQTTEMMIVSYKNKITLIKYFLFLICIGNVLINKYVKTWWVWEDLNFRPHPYQCYV